MMMIRDKMMFIRTELSVMMKMMLEEMLMTEQSELGMILI